MSVPNSSEDNSSELLFNIDNFTVENIQEDDQTEQQTQADTILTEAELEMIKSYIFS
jgi:hypothetical protein